ncbi:MAG: hypothetical protein U0V75_00515 [Ferruginibacter sp.]
MGDNNNNESNKSRRWFLSLFVNGKEKNSAGEKVKMLTPDGKLVEVDKSVFEKAEKQKADNKMILDWMKNPSKDF